MSSIHLFTSGPCKLQKNAHSLSIWLASGFRLRGIVPERMWNFFSLPIALSTCILKRAMFLVFTTSAAFRRFPLPQLHFLVNGGIISLAFLSRSKSRMGKPRSAMISSPCFTWSRNPLSLVIYRSETLPPHRLDTNVLLLLD